ncbi:MAG: DUF305 domain-containing protein, partial [Microcoleaceae cyanobacterium]
MKNKTLIYSLVSLVAGSTLTGILLINQRQATAESSTILGQNTQNVPNMPNPPGRGMGMGMGMNQEQKDQHFIQMMIPHHQGAVDMANLALEKAQNPELKTLAEAIKTSQTMEINQMKEWYKQWYGADVPNTSNMPMHSGQGMNHGSMQSGQGMNHGMHSNMMGMMNTDLTALKNAPNFDQAFVQQMIPHHQMAIMMSSMILNSSHPELRNL